MFICMNMFLQLGAPNGQELGLVAWRKCRLLWSYCSCKFLDSFINELPYSHFSIITFIVHGLFLRHADYFLLDWSHLAGRPRREANSDSSYMALCWPCSRYLHFVGYGSKTQRFYL